MMADAQNLLRAGRPATIGYRESQRLAPAIRGDHIRWIDASDLETAAALADTVAVLKNLMSFANQFLHCGLRGFESHIALYPPGTGYSRHLDRLKDAPDERFISFVLYLNCDWSKEHGGELRVFTENLDPKTKALFGDHYDIAPLVGRLALFRSDLVWHQVLATSRNRLSITGWFIRGADHMRILFN